MRIVRRTSHTAAWERLAPDDVFTPPVHTSEAQAQLMANQAHAAYQAQLQAMFRGLGSSSDVLRARVAWCTAESRLVDLHAHQPKPMKRTREPWRVTR